MRAEQWVLEPQDALTWQTPERNVFKPVLRYRHAHSDHVRALGVWRVVSGVVHCRCVLLSMAREEACDGTSIYRTTRGRQPEGCSG
jgi:hypothetical protein